MSNVVSRAEYHPVAREQGPISKLLGLPFKMAWVLLFSLILSIVIEWVGMSFIWREQGAGHAENMMLSEMRYLGLDFQQGIFKPGRKIAGYVTEAYQRLFVNTGILHFIDQLPVHAREDSLKGVLAGFLLTVQAHVHAAIFISMTFVLRLFILLFALPAFFLFILVGMTDGLVQRDIRRWSGGRESSFVYHLAKGWVRPLMIAPWILYLALPWSVHPNLVILPFALLCGLVIWITTSSFKKYL